MTGVRAWLLGLVVWAAASGASATTVLVLGDSLSAGYGIALEDGWVDLLRERLAASGEDSAVVNASISGDTTRGGRTRIGARLADGRTDVLIVELGGNDGLRGLPLDETRANLAAIVEAGRAAGARVLLLGMRLPPNLGPRYAERFHALYHEVAAAHGAALVPFFLEGVGGVAELMQDDGIHPRAEAQPRLLENVWFYLEPLL